MTDRLHSALILSETFGVRLRASEGLTEASGSQGGDVAILRENASRLDGAAARFLDAQVGVVIAAFADLNRVAALLVDWRRAVFDAEPDPDRFKRSALERLKLWRADNASKPSVGMMTEAITGLDEVTLADVGPFCLKLARVPLPIGMREKRPNPFTIDGHTQREMQDREALIELHVAFLSFTVDGAPADQIQFLTPHETHDLEIEVRVSRWPDGASELHLSAVSIESAGAYDLPKFVFVRPAGNAPFVVRQRGRAVIKVAQALRAQPFEFRYAAEFSPKETEQPISVVGHRTLRIESIDLHRSPMTGYAALDSRLLDIRNRLRAISPMPQGDLEAAMTMVVPISGLAARAVQDAIFPKAISEAEFQQLVRNELRRVPEVGSRLEEHARAAGGETDLSLSGIRLELKVVVDRRLILNDCQRFVEQAATYAVGSGKRLALLCVLDVSTKEQAPFPIEEGVGILFSESNVPVLTILVQGCLVRPSDLSRRRSAVRGRDKA
jgi:hypothetical protein